MQRGFKAHIKRVAADLRTEMRLSAFDPFDPIAACKLLEIPVLALTGLSDCPDAIVHFTESASGDFSAVTGFCGTRRFIIINDAHHPHRQASSLAHELGHALLQHPPAPVLRGDGMRNFDGEIEEQAAFFSGAVLLPDEACRMIMKRKTSLQDAARAFGVSESMVDYRLKVSGARKIHSRQTKWSQGH